MRVVLRSVLELSASLLFLPKKPALATKNLMAMTLFADAHTLFFVFDIYILFQIGF
jgi:hypothetical protein